MRLYEYEAKALFRENGINIPESLLIDKNVQWDILKTHITYPAVVKAQILTGKRGKRGLIKIVSSKEETAQAINTLMDTRIDGMIIEKVLIERKENITEEYYLSITIDRMRHKPVIIISHRGGMDIEEVNKTFPADIYKYYKDVGEKLQPYEARKIASIVNTKRKSLLNLANIILTLYNKLFLKFDAKLVEINPLGRIENHWIALDGKIDIDEDGFIRHPELKEQGIQLRHEVGELNEREKKAKASGIPYVELDGNIGVFPGGAGFGIASIDLIAHYGGKAANFMDSGGAPTQERLKTMLGLLMDNPNVKVIFGARFGGISRCDDWAKAVCEYVLTNHPKKPMIMRMTGNMEEEGRKIFDEAKKQHPEYFKHIAVYSADKPIEEVIKEAVNKAKEV